MKYLLFTTTHCPKCPAMKEFVANKITFPGESINETHPDFHTKAQQHKVASVPTLIIFNQNNQELHRATDPSVINIAI